MILTLLTVSGIVLPFVGHNLKHKYMTNIRYFGQTNVQHITQTRSTISLSLTPMKNIIHEHWIIHRKNGLTYELYDYKGNISFVPNTYVSYELGGDSIDNLHNRIKHNTIYKYYGISILCFSSALAILTLL